MSAPFILKRADILELCPLGYDGRLMRTYGVLLMAVACARSRPLDAPVGAEPREAAIEPAPAPISSSSAVASASAEPSPSAAPSASTVPAQAGCLAPALAQPQIDRAVTDEKAAVDRALAAQGFSKLAIERYPVRGK